MNRIARMGAVFKAKRKQNPVGCLHPDWAAYRLEQPSALRTSSGSARRGGRRGSVSRSTACCTASCAEPLDTEQAWGEHGRRPAAPRGLFSEHAGTARNVDGGNVLRSRHPCGRYVGLAGERTPLTVSVGDADNPDRFNV